MPAPMRTYFAPIWPWSRQTGDVANPDTLPIAPG